MIGWQIDLDSGLYTDPPVVYTTASVVVEFTFDTTTIATGATGASTQLKRLDTREPVTLPGASFASGTVTQVVRGLERGVDYELSWLVTFSATNKPVRLTVIRCLA